MFRIIPDELILIIYKNILKEKYDNFKNLLILSKRFNKISYEYINNNIHPFYHEKLPKLLKNAIHINTHKIELIKDFNNIISLNVSKSKVTEIPQLSPNIPYLDIQNNELTNFKNFPSNLVTCNCYNEIRSFEDCPQNIQHTFNCSHNKITSFENCPQNITMAILYNILINQKENIEDIDIIFTAFCCGYGKMEEDESIQQIIDGIKDYVHYKPKTIYKNIIINEPNL